ncbi:MAG: element excision factor XisH family protein [Bacteroidota bacterium]
MSAQDKYHELVKAALQKDGWTITHDPLKLKVGKRKLKIDLGAERVLAAEKGEEKIAIEIKSFLGPSLLTDFYHALGQYSVYRLTLAKVDETRTLFLARAIASAFQNIH